MTIRKFQYEDPIIGVVDTIIPPIKNESSQSSPYRHSTLQRTDGSGNASCTTILGDDSLVGGPSHGSSSSLDTIKPPINHENPQLFPYPSSTTLQSNGSIYNASFMTSPSCDTFFEVRNYNAEVSESAPAPALAEEQPEWQSDLQVDIGRELKSVVDSILQDCPKYMSSIV